MVATSDIADYVIRSKAPASPDLGAERPPASDLILIPPTAPNKESCPFKLIKQLKMNIGTNIEYRDRYFTLDTKELL